MARMLCMPPAEAGSLYLPYQARSRRDSDASIGTWWDLQRASAALSPASCQVQLGCKTAQLASRLVEFQNQGWYCHKRKTDPADCGWGCVVYTNRRKALWGRMDFKQKAVSIYVHIDRCLPYGCEHVHTYRYLPHICQHIYVYMYMSAYICICQHIYMCVYICHR